MKNLLQDAAEERILRAMNGIGSIEIRRAVAHELAKQNFDSLNNFADRLGQSIACHSDYHGDSIMSAKGTKTKTSKRTIRLPEQLVTILSEYKVWYDEQKINYGDLWADTDKLFLQDNGNTLNPCTINLWLRKFNLEHGFKNIPPHSLRHTSITMQIKAGVPIKAVSARAGHSSERITVNNQYGHTIINNIIKAVIF